MKNTDQQAQHLALINAGLKKRRRAETRFRIAGRFAIMIALAFMLVMFSAIISRGSGAFQRTYIEMPVYFDRSHFGDQSTQVLQNADYSGLLKSALRSAFPHIKSRSDKRQLYRLVSNISAFELRRIVLDKPEVIGRSITVSLPASDEVDLAAKSEMTTFGRLSETQISLVQRLQSNHQIRRDFNYHFFTSGDSREPELAGIAAALAGSFFTIVVCVALSFFLGVMAAIYLEEFAARNKLTEFIEVNINNLAAVPSIVFGLLGLAVFLNFFHLPRSASLVGGMVLALMSLPTIIIAGRASLKAVPNSIREAALGIGASKVQTVFFHTLPLALPGIFTGTIIAMARAMGETAPLLMIGMVAFIVDIPTTILDPATSLPVQVYLWADSPERAFEQKTAAAIMVLLAFLVVMNLTAVLLRKKFEIRW